MSKKTFHENAFLDYCHGKSSKEIAAVYKVKPRTVNVWCSLENWVKLKRQRGKKIAKKREALFEKFQETTFMELANDTEEIAKSLLYSIKMLAIFAGRNCNSVAKIMEQNKRGEEIEDNPNQKKIDRRITVLTKQIQGAASAFKLAVPGVSDELGLKIIEEFSDIDNQLKESFYNEDS